MQDHSQRVLPLLTISDIEFYVDAYHSVLIEKGNPDNRLHSLEMMVFEDHYEFVLDTNSRKIYEGKWIGPLPQEAEYVWIRPFAMIPKGWTCFSRTGMVHGSTTAVNCRSLKSKGTISM